MVWSHWRELLDVDLGVVVLKHTAGATYTIASFVVIRFLLGLALPHEGYFALGVEYVEQFGFFCVFVQLAWNLIGEFYNRRVRFKRSGDVGLSVFGFAY